MFLNDLTELLKNKGFKNTIQVLGKFKNYRAERRKFYEELMKFSYYNSFYRIKGKLLEYDLINIKSFRGKKYISLTKKGKKICEKLNEIYSILSE